jgi:hypothetical protein
MKRSTGVTVSSIFVFIGSGTTLFFAALMMFAGTLLRAEAQQPPSMTYAIFAIAMLEVGFAAWGVASGVGLLRLREWARISIVIFSALLLLMSLPGLAVMLAMPLMTFQNADGPDVSRQAVLFTRAFMSIFYGLLISIAVFWLYFFNTRFVRDQFKGAALAAAGVAVSPDSGGHAIAVTGSNPASTPRRPTSVSIIGWYLVASAVCGFIFPTIRIPMLFLWFMLRGPKATAYVLILAILQIIIGIGLLKLREWARILAICYLAFLTLNALTTALAPGAQARYQEFQVEIQNIIRASTAYGAAPTPVHVPVWFGVAFSLPLMAVVLWLLAKSKPAFAPLTQKSASQ